jgi:Fic family protein
MYDPKFSYTDKLVNTLIRIEHYKTYLQNIDVSYDAKHKLNTEAKSLDMFHLGHMLDLDITLKDGEKLAAGVRLDSISDDRAYMLSNFRNTLEFSRSNASDSYAEVDMTILLHLHKLIVTSWRETWDARFRNISDEVDQKSDNWVALRDESIPNEQVESQMAELISWYRDVTPILTPLVRIGILLYRIIEIYPYVAGNKLTIIAIADYLLLKNGLSTRSFMSVVKDFVSNEEKYIEAILMSKKNFDLTIWLETFSAGIIKDLIEVRENLSEYLKEDEKSKKQPFLDLSKRQLKVLRYLQTVPLIKREDYCHMMEVSTMTAFRDLHDLVRKKLLKVEGKGRGTKYRLASM